MTVLDFPMSPKKMFPSWYASSTVLPFKLPPLCGLRSSLHSLFALVSRAALTKKRRQDGPKSVCTGGTGVPESVYCCHVGAVDGADQRSDQRSNGRGVAGRGGHDDA